MAAWVWKRVGAAELKVMLKDSFLEYLRSERNRSSNTVVKYEVALREFETFFKSLGEGLDWNTVDASVVREWILYMVDEEGKTESTVCLHLSALRSFYRYLTLVGKVHKNPMAKVVAPKKKKALPSFVREQDMDNLLDKTDFGNDFRGARDRLVVLMLYTTGMRRAELLGLRDEDIRLDDGVIKVTGKRNKQRLIPFGEELRGAVEHYLELRNAEFAATSGNARFFLGRKGQGLSVAEVERIVGERLATVPNLSKRSPHVLRHTFATVMLNHGAGLETIQKLLGHERVETTQIYTHLSLEELKNEYKDAHPHS